MESDRQNRIAADRLVWLSRAVLLAFACVALVHLARPIRAGQEEQGGAQIRLGARLFKEDRFASGKGDLIMSCAHCHQSGEEPERVRAFTDSFTRSWVPWRSGDPRREGVRNAPTLFDVTAMPRLHFDGEFASLEALVRGTLAGRNYGWLPGEEDEARRQVYQTLINDVGGATTVAYAKQFKEAFGVELERLGPEQVMELIGKAITAYMRTLKSAQDSPYDRFIQANGLDARPAQGESATAYGARILRRVDELESRGALKLSKEFDAEALDGLKLFLRTEGGARVGNCVACHVPPLFTDASFHNLGITQSEYDQVHGEGRFVALRIPAAADAHRPLRDCRETPVENRPERVDLGYWNFVKLDDATLRRQGESDERFLRRMIATFKTPTLRNLAYSRPYMHNGAYPSLESAISELSRLARMAREGHVREADDGLAKIQLSESDIRPLVVFLTALNEDLKEKLMTAAR
ncbi:MAG TPA: cytochrome c peroxidase [Blastocatellia bacterium]|nr:cytochrome c peroxidase [Blastocatellia bacterium]